MRAAAVPAVLIASLLLLVNVSAFSQAAAAQLNVGDKWAVGTDRLLELPDDDGLQDIIDKVNSWPKMNNSFDVSLQHESSGYVTFEVTGETSSTYGMTVLAAFMVNASGEVSVVYPFLPDGTYNSSQISKIEQVFHDVTIAINVSMAWYLEFKLVLSKSDLSVSSADVSARFSEEIVYRTSGVGWSDGWYDDESNEYMSRIHTEDTLMTSNASLRTSFHLEFDPAIKIFRTAAYPQYETRATLSDGVTSGEMRFHTEPEGFFDEYLPESPAAFEDIDIFAISSLSDSISNGFSENVEFSLPFNLSATDGRIYWIDVDVNRFLHGWDGVIGHGASDIIMGAVPDHITLKEVAFSDAKSGIDGISSYEAALGGGSGAPDAPQGGDVSDGSGGFPWVYLALVAVVAAIAVALVALTRRKR